MSFTAEALARISWNWDEDGTDLDSLTASLLLGDGSVGTPADAVIKFDAVVLGDASATNYNLMVLVKAVFGGTTTISLQKVMAVCVTVTAASTGSARVGGAAANAFEAFYQAAGDEIVVPPGGMFVIANNAGWTVDATHKMFDVKAVGGAIVYSLAIVGLKT